MGGKAERYFIPAAIGFAPFVLLLLTWAPHARSHAQELILDFYAPVVAVELFTIAVALREGMIGALRRRSWPRLPTAALVLLIVIAIGTAIVAPDPGTARIATFYWLLHLLFGFSVAHLCAVRFWPLDLVVAYLIGFAAFLAGSILFTAQVTDPNFNWTNGWPAAAHIRHLGYYIAAMVALCIGLAATERRAWVLGGLFVLSVASFAFALWTGSRGTVVGVVGAVIIGLLILPQIRRPQAWGGAALSLILGAAIARLFPAPASNMGFGRTVTATVDHEVTTGRTTIWRNVLGAIRHRPLLGYGEDQMATVAPFHGIIQTHDVFLQVLLAWGAVGFACVLVLAVWFVARSLPNVRHDGAGLLPPFMAMLALASFATIDGALFHLIPVSIFAACAGVIASGWHVPETRAP
ncbi:MAG TPA: O-antigen ligase family protein [Sphingomicrobium sp.]|nr:O-antigen ligase family protein [Sphingomicrobium sp.]